MAWIWRRRGDLKARDAEAATREYAALVQDYRLAFGGASGQRVLADLSVRCGLIQTSWDSDGAEATAFREGRRRVMLEIIELINADPAAAIRMAQSGQTEDLFNDD